MRAWKWATTFVLLCSLALAPGPANAADESQDKPFDEDRIAWQDADDLKFKGLRLAEQFRESLLQQGDARCTKASLLGAALERFRTDYPAPLSGRPTLERFDVTGDAFVVQLGGTKTLDVAKSFGVFSGRWYGKWDQMLVDHHWHPVVTDPARSAPGRSDRAGKSVPALVGLQYAWIGDGFGWNYLVRPTGAPGSVVLGYVYHLTPHKPAEIRFESPLVGYFDGAGRLIWVTPSLIFFEEVLPGKSPQTQRYAITGFNYSIQHDTLVNVGDGFQAIYTRRPDVRPDWLEFPLTLSVSCER